MKAELSYRLLVTLLFASEQQWGAWSGNFTSTSTVTFPIAFSTCYSVVLTGLYNSSGSAYNDGDAHVMTISASQFTAKVDQNAYRWIAIGK